MLKHRNHAGGADIEIPQLCALHIEPALGTDDPEALALALQRLRKSLDLIAPDSEHADLRAIADVVKRARLAVAPRN